MAAIWRRAKARLRSLKARTGRIMYCSNVFPADCTDERRIKAHTITTMKTSLVFLYLFIVFGACAQQKSPDGFTSLFNGKDLSGWKIPAGDNGHWKVVDGVIDYDAMSEAKDGKDLWTDKTYKD